MRKSIFTLIFLGLAFQAGGATVGRDNQYLGTVTVDREDLAKWRDFVPQLEKAMEVARAIGVTEIPVRRANFSGETMEPGYSAADQVLNIGSLPPRRKGDSQSSNLLSLHEVGHVVLFQALANRRGVPFITFFAEYFWAFGRGVLGSYEEFFADAFSQMLIGDPVGISRHIRDSNNWYNRLPLAERERFSVSTGLYNLSNEGLSRRDFVGPDTQFCGAVNPEAHHWFDTSRRVLWDEIFSRRYKQDPESIAIILSVLVDYADLLITQTVQNRTAMQPYLDAPAPRSLSEVLTRPIPLTSLPEDYFDYALRNYLRTRFP